MGYLARAAFKAGKYAEASKILLKALHLSPDNKMLMLRTARDLFAWLKGLKKQKYTETAAEREREEKCANEELQQSKTLARKGFQN